MIIYRIIPRTSPKGSLSVAPPPSSVREATRDSNIDIRFLIFRLSISKKGFLKYNVYELTLSTTEHCHTLSISISKYLMNQLISNQRIQIDKKVNAKSDKMKMNLQSSFALTRDN